MTFILRVPKGTNMSSSGNAATLDGYWKGKVPGEGKVYLRGEGKRCEIDGDELIIDGQRFNVTKSTPLCTTEAYVGDEKQDYSVRNIGAVQTVYTIVGTPVGTERAPIKEDTPDPPSAEAIQRVFTLLEECLKENKQSYQTKFLCPDWLESEATLTQKQDAFVSSAKALYQAEVGKRNCG